MDRAKGARPIVESLASRSGVVSRSRDTFEPVADTRGASQLRRRLDLEAEASERAPSSARRDSRAVDDEPEEGIPTSPRMIALGAVPKRIVRDSELLNLPLDHRAGFVLAHIDGSTDLATLIDVCGMTHDALVALLQQLLSLRVIRLT